MPDSMLEFRWNRTLNQLGRLIGKRPENLDTVLFLIGVQELGQGVRRFSKEEKQDLMHIAVCRLLSKAQVYKLVGRDAQGWPQWQRIGDIPYMNLEQQEQILKEYAIEYFIDEGILSE
ncbi:MAG: hypothetical protein NZ551_01015 [Microscillaceae bacterium]|nr:hypothetical protein [Microscillaceae bacterium]MDW8459769.1 hypothetical protein [Cytophagales bacterium]